MTTRNVIKTVFLLVLNLATIGLLAVCLLSPWWITIKKKSLEKARMEYTHAYMAFSGHSIANNKLEVPANKSLPATTTVKPDDPFDTYDYDTYSYNYEEGVKTKRDVIDYVYITSRWPLIKLKSLYSECIEYTELHLKVSTGYLVKSRKRPIVGQINYGKEMNSIIQSERGMAGTCEPGMIRCALTQQCVNGKYCDGQIDCDDHTDEHQCTTKVTCLADEFSCDNKCWKMWYKCDQQPHCSDLSDELECGSAQDSSMFAFFSRILQKPVTGKLINGELTKEPTKSEEPFTLGKYHYDKQHKCFVHYFDFKSAKLISKENLKFLTHTLADHIQQNNNIDYHMQLIYSLSFCAALAFSFMSLASLMFVLCFKKLCFQCPFWFYGFFNILAWLASFFGLITFLYECFANHQRTLDPLTRLPIDNELIRLNTQLSRMQEFGVSFWFAVAATCVSFFGSFVSCIICCRLPTARHEDKEYKIMQLPTYS